VTANVKFTGQTPDGRQVRWLGYYSTIPLHVTTAQDLDLTAVAAQLTSDVNWASVGLVLDRITEIVIVIAEFRPINDTVSAVRLDLESTLVSLGIRIREGRALHDIASIVANSVHSGPSVIQWRR